MRTNRTGFTVTELAMAMVIIGIVSAMALPKLNTARQREQVRGAQTVVASYLATARAAAIQRGRTAHFVRSGNQVWVVVTTSGAPLTVAPAVQLDSSYHVTLSTNLSRDTISFDSRGLARRLPTTGGKIVVAGAAGRDSVCVTRFGMVQPQGCL